jgi:hypothetical protein
MRLAAFSTALLWLALAEIAYVTSTSQYLDSHDIRAKCAPAKDLRLIYSWRSQRGSNPRNGLEKNYLRRSGCERKLTNTHQGDHVPVNMVSTDDSGRIA